MLGIFLLLFSCSKHQVTNHNAARDILNNHDCLELLEQQIKATNCPQVNFTSASPHDIMFRCRKDDSQRGAFWDNYIFRISPADLQYDSQEDLALIRKHTICIDAKDRIEAYPPP